MSIVSSSSTKMYGLVAEYAEPSDIMKAAKAIRHAGFTKMNAYTPFPVHGLDEAIGFKDHRLKWLVFACGLTGMLGGMGLQYYTSVIDYPWNVGGKPLFSWPAFIPVTFECTILLSAFGAVFGMLAMNKLPKPWQPIFSAKNFERATNDRFFLYIDQSDKIFDVKTTKDLLLSTGALEVSELVTTQEGY